MTALLGLEKTQNIRDLYCHIRECDRGEYFVDCADYIIDSYVNLERENRRRDLTQLEAELLCRSAGLALMIWPERNA
jgi:hypothetical protein